MAELENKDFLFDRRKLGIRLEKPLDICLGVVTNGGNVRVIEIRISIFD